MRGVPSTVRPWNTSTLALAAAKPDNAWVSSLSVAGLAPAGAKVAPSVAPLAFTKVTEPATTDRAPGPAADVVLGTVDIR